MRCDNNRKIKNTPIVQGLLCSKISQYFECAFFFFFGIRLILLYRTDNDNNMEKNIFVFVKDNKFVFTILRSRVPSKVHNNRER